MKKNRIIALTIFIVNIILFILMIFLPNIMIKHFKIVEPLKFIFSSVLFFLPTYVAIIIYFVSKNRNNSMKKVSFIAVLILNILSFIFCFIVSFVFHLSNIVISETTSVDDYMVLDKFLGNLDTKIFPTTIPNSAKNIKYFYRCRRSLDYNYDIYLEVTLSKDEYEKEKQRIRNYEYEDVDVVKSNFYNNRIDYIIGYNYIDVNNLNDSYFVRFVSFSDSDLNVRYIISSALDSSDEGAPYFLEQK